jgi:hypothetical protein
MTDQQSLQKPTTVPRLGPDVPTRRRLAAAQCESA